jgi:AraC-like DNA-binding protein
MNRIKILTVFVLGVMAITITLGAVVYHSASASPSTNQAADTSDSDSNAPTGKGHGEGSHSYSDEDLAAALGITVDELTTARQKAYEKALAQAVEQGLLTQAEADEMSSDGHMKGWLAKNNFDYDALLAEALGISEEKLQTAYTQAYNANLDQAVTEGTLTQEQADLMKGKYALRANSAFQASMQAAFETAVQQAVEGGVITQAQADQILKSKSASGLGSFLDKGGPGSGRHGGGHRENVPAGTSEHLEEETATP